VRESGHAARFVELKNAHSMLAVSPELRIDIKIETGW
jgi:hypothetical protein